MAICNFEALDMCSRWRKRNSSLVDLRNFQDTCTGVDTGWSREIELSRSLMVVISLIISPVYPPPPLFSVLFLLSFCIVDVIVKRINETRDLFSVDQTTVSLLNGARRNFAATFWFKLIVNPFLTGNLRLSLSFPSLLSLFLSFLRLNNFPIISYQLIFVFFFSFLYCILILSRD